MSERLIKAADAKEALLGWDTEPTDEEIEIAIDGCPTAVSSPAASESLAMFADKKKMRADRELFVENLGWLLSQTREGIAQRWLDEDDCVHVRFAFGGVQTINVKHDSYMAIIRDVSGRL